MPSAPSSDRDQPPRRRSRVRLLLGLIDLVFAAVYAALFFAVIPSRHAWFQWAVVAVCVFLAIGGLGMLSRKRWGLYLGAGGAVVLLVSGLAVIWGLLASAFYLSGIYGGFGRGASLVLLLVVALVFEGVCLLPIVQLWWVRRAIGDESAGVKRIAARATSREKVAE